MNSQEYQDIWSDLSDFIENEEILNDKVTESQKEELIESLSFILQKQTRELLNDRGRKRKNTAYNFPPNYPQPSTNRPSCINLYLIMPPQTPFYPPNYTYNQLQSNPTMNTNPYYANYPAQPNSPSYFQQPNIYSNSQPNIYSNFQQPLNSLNSYQPNQIDQSRSNKKSHKKEKKHEKDKESKILKFNHTDGQEFKGIINYLTEKTGGNIHKNGTIELTSISPDFHTYPDYLLNQSQDYHFNPQDVICYDFKNMKIEISSYTIKSINNPVGHIKNWVFEVSNDKDSWTEIDKHTDDPTMNSPGKVATFNVKKKKFARFVRFRHTGEYWKAVPGIMACSIRINSIEFYGRLEIPKKDKKLY